MACPYFFPVEPRACADSARFSMLPLGDSWAGQCRADPEHAAPPPEASLHTLCNLGYARGSCSRFPASHGPDAARFSLTLDAGSRLGMCYVLECDHLPFAHGPLEYSVEMGAFVAPPAGGVLRRQAEAYVQSYLRRKDENPAQRASGE